MDKGEKSSAEAKTFVEHLKNLHEEVRKHINKMDINYKAKANKKMRYKELKIQEEVMVHLRKERFPMGTYNKSNMKKLGPHKILKKRDLGNAHELELPSGLNISFVFNISDSTKYHEGGLEDEIEKTQWNIPTTTLEEEEIEDILDSHVGASIRNKQYEEYLVKSKGRPIEDSSRLSKDEVDHLGFPQTPKM
ncbi:uncharacterized protein LOC131068915 [Cryptomeria japonica]|uniref:uncharacterized protein LOC131068915 n=1 Tax=Cryptomeria japonica TaxID=3369 RepID=UPI0027DA9449|nr:uncharacterized protein LOC131068915 [Cryptomeria japonica]